MNINIEVLSSKLVTATNAKGKSYQVCEVAFKNLGTGKVEGKKLFGFGDQVEAFKVLSQASTGEQFTIDSQKIGDFWNWITATRGVTQGAPAEQAPSVGLAGPVGRATASPKSTYATPEERQQTQVYIVRQSNITASINMLSPGAKTSLDLDRVLALAAELENYVFGTSKKINPAQPLIDMEDDIPD